MKFIETFKPNCRHLVYKRFRQQGRMLPVGLQYQPVRGQRKSVLSADENLQQNTVQLVD